MTYTTTHIGSPPGRIGQPSPISSEPAQRAQPRDRRNRQYPQIDFQTDIAADCLRVSHPPSTNENGAWLDIGKVLRDITHIDLLSQICARARGRFCITSLNTVLDQLEHKKTERGQCCFICFEIPGRGAFAVILPCLRPRKFRTRAYTEICPATGQETVHYEGIQPEDRAVECDTDIYHRVLELCYRMHGQWRRRLPFYGLKEVHEVEFEFRGGVNHDGSLPVVLYAAEPGTIREQAHSDIRLAEAQGDDYCFDRYHGQYCDARRFHSGEPCVQDQGEEAKKRLRKLDCLHLLKDFVANPALANGEFSLTGMALNSWIFEMHGESRVIVPERNMPYDRTDRLWGLQVTMGWRWYGLERSIMFVWPVAAISTVWLCTIWWMQGSGNASTAMGFGQLIAASISLLILHSAR